jgi:hypothetical protein
MHKSFGRKYGKPDSQKFLEKLWQKKLVEIIGFTKVFRKILCRKRNRKVLEV